MLMKLLRNFKDITLIQKSSITLNFTLYLKFWCLGRKIFDFSSIGTPVTFMFT